MAFSSSITGSTVIGDRRIIFGTFSQADTDSGGDISTGYGVVNACGVIPTGQVDSDMPKYTISGGTITVVTGNGVDGNWWAVGK